VVFNAGRFSTQAGRQAGRRAGGQAPCSQKKLGKHEAASQKLAQDRTRPAVEVINDSNSFFKNQTTPVHKKILHF